MAARGASRVVVAVVIAGAAACSLDWSVPQSHPPPVVAEAGAVLGDATSDAIETDFDVRMPPSDVFVPSQCDHHASCGDIDNYFCSRQDCPSSTPGVSVAPGDCVAYEPATSLCKRGMVCGCNGQPYEFCDAVRGKIEFTPDSDRCPTLGQYFRCDDVYCQPGQFCLQQKDALARCVNASDCQVGECVCYQMALEKDLRQQGLCNFQCTAGSPMTTCASK